MHCYECGTERHLASGERIAFRDVCSDCGTDLHVCRNCAHHDPSAYNECRESSSERVSDRERANRCDYFAPGPTSPGSAATAGSARESLAELESLFKK